MLFGSVGGELRSHWGRITGFGYNPAECRRRKVPEGTSMALGDLHGSFHIGPKCLTPERRLWERMGTCPFVAPHATMRSIDFGRTVQMPRFCLGRLPTRFQAFSASPITNLTQ